MVISFVVNLWIYSNKAIQSYRYLHFPVWFTLRRYFIRRYELLWTGAQREKCTYQQPLPSCASSHTCSSLLTLILVSPCSCNKFCCPFHTLSFAQSCKPPQTMIMFFPLYWSKLRLTLFKAIPEQVPLNGSSVSGWSLLLFIVFSYHLLAVLVLSVCSFVSYFFYTEYSLPR